MHNDAALAEMVMVLVLERGDVLQHASVAV